MTTEGIRTHLNLEPTPLLSGKEPDLFWWESNHASFGGKVTRHFLVGKESGLLVGKEKKARYTLSVHTLKSSETLRISIFHSILSSISSEFL